MQEKKLFSSQGFGLIGIMIAIFIILLFAFGFRKLHPAEKSPTESDTSLGTYKPISADGMKGQLEAGFEAKQNAQDTVKKLQDRVANDAKSDQ